ncbi:MAG: DUF2130 domain-containing protein [Deltaproteobacteria bacterium]|nr:DUF2130 domain-containing protein [Deltaproteobacteria bacterium]
MDRHMQRDGFIASEQIIVCVCPLCSGEFPLTEALFNRVRDSVKTEFAPVEAELKRREAELDKKKAEMESAISERVNSEMPRLREEAKKDAYENAGLEIRALREKMELKEKLLEEAQKNELELRKRAGDIDEREKTIELTLERRLAFEKEKIRQSTLDMFTNEHRLKDMEKDKRIGDLMKSLEEAKRRAEQGSQQSQGEALELDLEAVLKQRFQFDVIEPVPKGVRGADIIQRVANRGGQLCGMIVWEAKRTKAWNDAWIAKLKDDQREIKAEFAVLVTETLPKDINSFAQREGVWVTGFSLASGLAEILRAMLIQVAQAKNSVLNKGEKMEAVYNYLSGPGFRHRVEAIIDAHKAMKKDLDDEKAASMKVWAKRDKQIDRITFNMAGMYGDMQGIMGGAALPDIKPLELGGGDEQG